MFLEEYSFSRCAHEASPQPRAQNRRTRLNTNMCARTYNTYKEEYPYHLWARAVTIAGADKGGQVGVRRQFATDVNLLMYEFTCTHINLHVDMDFWKSGVCRGGLIQSVRTTLAKVYYSRGCNPV